MMSAGDEILDCIVIGGGQSGLAVAYYLRRAKLNYRVLDKQPSAGGSWNHVWDSLHLFSAAKHNALPGFPMPKTKDTYPSKKEVIHYLEQYEKKYDFPIDHGVVVERVEKQGELFELYTNVGVYKAKSVVSATGTQAKPFIPKVPGIEDFEGDQLHSSSYKNPDEFLGKRVLIVGAGNSGAQIYAELAQHTLCFWGVKEPPEFLPPDVDGKTLFDQATQIYNAKKRGEEIDKNVFNLGNIVMVPEVKEAVKRGAMDEYYILDHLKKHEVVWKDGSSELIDAIIWCTGFGYHTTYLRDLISLDEKGKAKTEGTRSLEVEGLWLVGYGGWTGMASATIIGVGRTAKKTVKEIQSYLDLL